VGVGFGLRCFAGTYPTPSHANLKWNQRPPAAVREAVAQKSVSTGRPYTSSVRKKRILWGFLSFLALVLVTFGVWVYRVANSLTGQGFGGIGNLIRARTDPRQLFPGKERIVVLILGKDYNRDRKGMPYTKGSRSDTMMVLGVDIVNPRITAVSIPRDSRITSPDGVTGKMNAVITRGGPRLVEDTLSSNFGVRPDYYVVLKPDAVRKIVDALGGVEVEALDDMNYDDNWGQLHVHIPKGRHHLNGEQAEGYVRFRKSSGKRTHKGPNLEEGDIRRAARQQQLIHAMVDSAKAGRNLPSLPGIIDTGFEQIETNMSRTQLLALGSFFQEASGTAMAGGTLPGTDSQDSSFDWILDLNRSTKMMQWLINGDRYAGQSLPRIAVYNNSNAGNAARSVASLLYAEGYDAFNGGGRKPLEQTSSVEYRFSLYKSQADQLAARLGTGPASKDPDSNPADTWSAEIHVNVGTDLAQKFTPVTSGRTTSTTVSRGRSRRSHR
jgi:polyisoprenyl-teichoic acid--peptidoglycan teichoic acid transferase